MWFLRRKPATDNWLDSFYLLPDAEKRELIVQECLSDPCAMATTCAKMAHYVRPQMIVRLLQTGYPVGGVVARRFSERILRRIAATNPDAISRTRRVASSVYRPITDVDAAVVYCAVGKDDITHGSMLLHLYTADILSARRYFEKLRARDRVPLHIIGGMLSRDMLKELAPKVFADTEAQNAAGVLHEPSLWYIALVLAGRHDSIRLLDAAFELALRFRPEPGSLLTLGEILRKSYIRPEMLSAVLERFGFLLPDKQFDEIVKGGVFPLLSRRARIVAAAMDDRFMSELSGDDLAEAKRATVWRRLEGL